MKKEKYSKGKKVMYPKIQFCHVSNAESVTLIKNLAAKFDGIDVRIEITPHHLFLHYDRKLDIPTFLKVLCPVRKKNENIKLQKSLKNGDISFIGTDHAPHTIKEKDEDFFNAPSGFPGLDVYVPFVLTQVFENKMSLENFTKYASFNLAKCFGLKNKGQLKPGFDADIIIVENTKPYKIHPIQFKSKSKFSPYPLDNFQAKIIYVFLGGKLVVNNDPKLLYKYPQLAYNIGEQIGKLLLHKN